MISSKRRRRLVALQDPPPGAFVELEDAVVEFRTLLHQAQVGLPHGLCDACVHQRPEVERLYLGGWALFQERGLDRLSGPQMTRTQRGRQ